VLTTALLLLASRAVAAQSFTPSTATLGTMKITTAVAGSNPTSVTQAATKYTLATKKNAGQTHVTAQLSSPLPAGVTLTVTLPSPGGAIVGNTVSLTTAPQNVLTNLPNTTTTFAATTITYVLSATPAAGVVTLNNLIVTFTLQ
jgi:hypothetical protein